MADGGGLRGLSADSGFLIEDSGWAGRPIADGEFLMAD